MKTIKLQNIITVWKQKTQKEPSDGMQTGKIFFGGNAIPLYKISEFPYFIYVGVSYLATRGMPVELLGQDLENPWNPYGKTLENQF